MERNLTELKKYINKWPTKVFVFFVFSGLVVYVMWLVNIDRPLARERCSAEYPDFGVDPFDPLVQIELKSSVYPAGSSWVDGGVTRVCPCVMKPCVKKCCPHGETLTDTLKCVSSNRKFEFSRNLITYPNISDYFHGIQDQSIGENKTVNFVLMATRCPHKAYTKGHQNLFLMVDGRLWDKEHLYVWDQSQYCLEENETNNELAFVFCVDVENVVHQDKLRALQREIIWWVIFLVATFIHLVTLVVYGVIPSLQSGYGKSIICYVSAHFARSLLNILYGTKFLKESRLLCTLIAPVLHYSWLAARGWLLVIAYQIWTAFNAGPSKKGNAPRRQFMIYSALAWGLPLIQATLVLIIDLVSGFPDWLKGHFGEPKCWYNNVPAVVIHFIAPSVACELAIIAMCVANIVRLRNYKKNASTLRTNRRKCGEVQWNRIYMKLCLILGVNYLLVDLVLYYDWFHGTPNFVWQSALAISGMRGCEIFFIFVLNRKNRQNLEQSST